MLPTALQICCCDVLNSKARHSIGEDEPVPVYTEVTPWPLGARVLRLNSANTGMKMRHSTAQTRKSLGGHLSTEKLILNIQILP